MRHAPVRFKIAGLLWLMITIGYMDRVNISVVAPVIMKQMGWGEEFFGIIFSSFLFGYTIFQIPGGLAADRWGSRAILTMAVLGWSLFTALTPLAVFSFLLFLGVRFFVGIFESVASPAMAGINARWFPQKEFATAQMVGLAGSMSGQLVAFPLTTWLTIHYSWPTAFYTYAILGILWVSVWLYYSTNSPREHTSVTAAELEHIERGRSERGAAGESLQLPFSTLLRSRGILFLSLGYFFWTYSGWMMIAWLPTYLVKGRDFSLQQMGWVGMLPTAAAFTGIVMSGVISDYLFRRGRSFRFSRQGFPSFSIALGAILVVIAVSVQSPIHAVVFLVIFQLVNYFGTAGFWSTALALYPGQIASASGIMNFGGNVGGIFGPIVAGFLVARTGHWALPFYTAAVANVMAASVLFWGIRMKPGGQEVVAILTEPGLAAD